MRFAMTSSVMRFVAVPGEVVTSIRYPKPGKIGCMRGRTHKELKGLFLAAVLAAALCACGGGGGGGGGGAGGSSASGWTAGVFTPAASFAGQCAVPRPGIDRQGSSVIEKHWAAVLANCLFLWYDEIADPDPALWSTPPYFDLLKTAG